MAKISKRPQAVDLSDSSAREAGTATAAEPTIPPAYDRDRVATRAYQLYMERGGADGGDLDDWLSAERECRTDARPSDTE